MLWIKASAKCINVNVIIPHLAGQSMDLRAIVDQVLAHEFITVRQKQNRVIKQETHGMMGNVCDTHLALTMASIHSTHCS